MWQYRPTEELYHYGVPGMKWGHRKRIYGTYKNLRLSEAANKAGVKAYEKTYADARKSGETKKLGSMRRVQNRARLNARVAAYDARDAERGLPKGTWKAQMKKARRITAGIFGTAAIGTLGIAALSTKVLNNKPAREVLLSLADVKVSQLGF